VQQEWDLGVSEKMQLDLVTQLHHESPNCCWVGVFTAVIAILVPDEAFIAQDTNEVTVCIH
jgi:hypothetical protein